MTPVNRKPTVHTDRAAYARKRIERLNAKITRLQGDNALLTPMIGNDKQIALKIVIANDKQITSSRVAIKRWRAELVKLGAPDV